MMDPIYRIKDHIVALNSIDFDDEKGLEQYLSDVRETIRSYFNDRSQYFTYLGSIHFRPASVFSSTSDTVICWAKGKKQVRELLMVMLADAQAQFAEDIPVEESGHELQEAQRIVSGHIGGDVDVATLPRIRIDLCDIGILNRDDEGSRDFPMIRIPRRNAGSVLLFEGRDEGLNHVLADELGSADTVVIRIPGSFQSGRTIEEQFAAYSDARMVIVALGEDCWLSAGGSGKEADISSPSPAVCFSLGYLTGCLGRGRVAAFYREKPSFRRPTDSSELYYVPVDKSHGWRQELALRLKQNQIMMR